MVTLKIIRKSILGIFERYSLMQELIRRSLTLMVKLLLIGLVSIMNLVLQESSLIEVAIRIVRRGGTGGYDCTMYGGMCGAGMDNIFYANGKIFICGNCIDLPFSMPYDTPLNEVSFDVIDFDRSCCFKEVFTG